MSHQFSGELQAHARLHHHFQSVRRNALSGNEIVDLWINRLTVEPDGTITVNYQKKYRTGIKIVFDGILSIYKTDAGKTFYGEQSMCLGSYYWKTRHLVKHAEVSDIVVDFDLQ